MTLTKAGIDRGVIGEVTRRWQLGLCGLAAMLGGCGRVDLTDPPDLSEGSPVDQLIGADRYCHGVYIQLANEHSGDTWVLVLTVVGALLAVVSALLGYQAATTLPADAPATPSPGPNGPTLKRTFKQMKVVIVAIALANGVLPVLQSQAAAVATQHGIAMQRVNRIRDQISDLIDDLHKNSRRPTEPGQSTLPEQLMTPGQAGRLAMRCNEVRYREVEPANRPRPANVRAAPGADASGHPGDAGH